MWRAFRLGFRALGVGPLGLAEFCCQRGFGDFLSAFWRFVGAHRDLVFPQTLHSLLTNKKPNKKQATQFRVKGRVHASLSPKT